MNNHQILKELNQMGISPQIENLAWLAIIGWDSDFVRDFLYDNIIEDIQEVFPGLEEEDTNPSDFESYLFSNNKLGLLAEVHFREVKILLMENSKPKCWTKTCVSNIRYFYSESLDDLYEQMKTAANEYWEKAIKKELNTIKDSQNKSHEEI